MKKLAKIDASAKKIMTESSDAWVILNSFHASVAGLLTATYPVVKAMFIHRNELIEFVAPVERPRFIECMEDVKNKITKMSHDVRVIHDKHKGRYGHPSADDDAFAIAEEYTDVADAFADFQVGSLHIVTTAINDWIASVKGAENV